MNLLYVVDQFPKLSESFVTNELYELNKRGHNVSVFAINQPGESFTHEEVHKMDLTTYYGEQPSFGSFYALFSKRVLNSAVLRHSVFIDSPVYHARCLHLGKQIIEAVDEENGIDLIHTHFATPDRLAVTYASAYHDIPCTVTAHASEIFSPPNFQQLQRVCSRFNHILVPSEYNKRYLRDRIDVETDISVVPATTDVKKFEPSNDCVSGRLLTVARLVEKKGYKYAIDAVFNLIQQGYDVKYHIVGSGEREDILQDRVRKRGVEEHVEFLGNVSDERLETELQEAELFILPCVIASDGDRDVAPVALKEAMATQTACISTTISAIPELITDGEDGILVEPNNTDALVNSIAKLLNNSERRKTLAENGRNTVQTKFDISHTVDELIEVFSTVRSEYRN